jgi:dTDP-4-amino-4,6-dideoxygalactose transaminase
MGNIAMVDLVGQYQKLENEISERFREICNSASFIGGKYVSSFCHDLAEYLDVKHVIPCANGTDALQLALMALELKPGDEVITTSFTFVSTAEVIALLNLKPVFAEIDPDTFNIDPEDVRRKITSKTKCIIPVHLFGQAADMESIMAIANEHHIPVIEDNAQAIGCYYKSGQTKGYTGSMGLIGTCSFFPSKNLGCYGDGGAVTTNDDAIAAKLKMVANHGSSIRYYHDMIGVNSRLDNLQAAVLYTKLPHLDQYNETRRWAAETYNEQLADVNEIVCPPTDGKSTHVYHQYTMRVKHDRDGLSELLKSHEIGNAVYYPIPLHLQKAYQSLGYKTGMLPITEQASLEVLSLPIHSEITEDIISTVVDVIKSHYA